MLNTWKILGTGLAVALFYLARVARRMVQGQRDVLYQYRAATVSTFYPKAGTSVLNTPVGICVDSSGTVYVVDSGNAKIQKIASDGTLTTLALTSALYNPQYMALANGQLFVVDEGAGTLLRIDPTVVAPQSPLTVVNGQTAPTGVAMTWDGSTYEYYLCVTGSQVIIDNSAFVSGSGGTYYPAGYSSPIGVVVGLGSNFLYIADQGANVIRQVSLTGTFPTAPTTFAGTSAPGNTDNVIGTSATFSGPTGLAIDSYGNIYVADTGNNSIRKITPAGSVSTVASGLVQPTGIAAVGLDGSLYVTHGSHRPRHRCEDRLLKLTPASARTAASVCLRTPGPWPIGPSASGLSAPIPA